MLKGIPSVAVAASAPPDPERIYFEECAQVEFIPRASRCELRNAWWMAEASFAAYGKFDSVGKSAINLGPLHAAGYTVTADANGNTQFLAIENADVLIIAFRGTRLEGFTMPFLNGRGFAANWKDVVTDASFLPVIIESDVFIHGGFLAAFRGIEKQLGAVVDPALGKRPVWFCGHSLGAALATIAAYKYRDHAQGLCTFGSPRVGNGAFVRTLLANLQNIHRFVHHRDVVTTVPPEGLFLSLRTSDWLEILNRLKDNQHGGYTHVGQLKFISGGKTWSIQEGEHARDSIGALAADAFAHAKEVADVLTNGFSATDPGSWPILFDALADHGPAFYANKIFNACEEERLANG